MAKTKICRPAACAMCGKTRMMQSCVRGGPERIVLCDPCALAYDWAVMPRSTFIDAWGLDVAVLFQHRVYRTL